MKDTEFIESLTRFKRTVKAQGKSSNYLRAEQAWELGEEIFCLREKELLMVIRSYECDGYIKAINNVALAIQGKELRK